MANSKISALTSATTPVAGTEVLPIVQSSATKQLSIANLTPGLSTITAAKGGTGQTSYAVGDLLYADTTTTLAKLPDVATGNALISGGVGVAPSWGKIGNSTLTNSSITFGSTAVSLGGTVSALNGVTVGATTATTGKFTTLTSTGDTTLVNYQQFTSKQTSLAANTTTTIMTITQGSYLGTIAGVFEIIIQSGGYPDGIAFYMYSYAAQTSLGVGSWYGGGSSTLIASNSSMNGFSITTAPTFTATKSAGSYGNITITAKANNSCTAIVVFRGYSSGVTFS